MPARLGRINLAPEVDFDVADEARLNAASRNANAKAKLDLAIAKAGEKDLELARTQAANKLLREGKRDATMQNYIRDRETIPQIPVGVVNPQYLAKQMGPQEQGASQIDLSPIERKTRLDLSQISPEYSETFRTGMDTERETGAARTRLANAETRAEETRQETERHNREVENNNAINAELRRLGLVKGGKAGGTPKSGGSGGVGGVLGSSGKGIDPLKFAKAKTSAKGSVNELNATADVIDRLIGNEYKGIQPHPGIKGLTGYSSRVPYDVNQKTVDAEALRQQLLAKSAFAELQKMRQNSPTGGALGQVSDKEGEMLKNAAAALQRGQSPEQFRTNLEKFRAQLRISKQRIADAYRNDFGEDLPDDSLAQPPHNDEDWE